MTRRVENVGSLTLKDGSSLELTDYYSSPAGVSNLKCLAPDGSDRWSAQLLDAKMGHYVSVEASEGRIFAQSFDCYRIELDPTTGRAIAAEFTK